MIKKANIFFVFILALAFVQCSEDDIIVPKVETINTERVVLIEDFTGVKCPNCPNAARRISQLSELYPGKVVSIAYHTQFLGDPVTFPTEYMSKYDFRTPEGNQIEQTLGLYIGKPAVTLNRKKPSESDEFLLGSVDGLSNIEQELAQNPVADLIITNKFDAASRQLKATVEVKPLVDYSGQLKLTAVLLESHIFDTQIDNTVYKIDYEHNHVFRSLLSDINGDLLSNQLRTGEVIKKEYQFTIPAEAGWWKVENMEVVAFLSDYDLQPVVNNQKLNAGYVLQAGIRAVIE